MCIVGASTEHFYNLYYVQSKKLSYDAKSVYIFNVLISLMILLNFSEFIQTKILHKFIGRVEDSSVRLKVNERPINQSSIGRTPGGNNIDIIPKSTSAERTRHNTIVSDEHEDKNCARNLLWDFVNDINEAMENDDKTYI